ncbi:MAG TPA: endonuclease MutS2 [Chloroflexota bacterium]|nr:endonuclease MutS2 [Chloroflexota bacterium]
MNQKTLELLEFPRIRGQLASFCGFSASKDLALAIEPSTDGILVAQRQSLTSEAVRVLNQRPGLTVGAATDVRPFADRARRGGLLDAQELLAIRATIISARAVRAAVTSLSSLAPKLAELASEIVDCPALERAIGRCLGEAGDVLDSASPELARLRSEIRIAHQRLLDRLHDIVYGGTYRHALQEPVITMREGRYVVPVRSDARGQLRGLIHDRSSSGQTIYVEPLATVDLNNRWRELQLEEQHEIERIMRELSDQVASHAEAIEASVTALASVDFALAKARLAAEQQATEPILEINPGAVGSRGLRLINARHPLLHGRAVPINLWLGDDFQVMVITGPNTGGKTVALKTAGLLTLMAQAGLHIPADPGSQIHIFDDVRADIGDEQSIEQSLSTFSSHLRNVVAIVEAARANVLVLLDEVGAGTDPAEGSALARAILRYLLNRGAWVIATTHYSELKAFAHDTPGMTNASVEFNPETLTPTYRLQIGLPGRSNALAIAARLGLERTILDEAERLLDPGQIQVENLLEGIHAERRRAEQTLAALEAERQDIARIRAELVRRLDHIEEERRELLRRARQEAENELADLRAQLRQAAAVLQRTERSRGELVAAAQALEAASRQMARPAAMPSRLPGLPSLPRPAGAGRVAVGDRVRVRSLERDGEVVAILDDGAAVEVHIGNFKLKVGTDDVERLGRAAEVTVPRVATGPTVWNLERREAPPRQLDLRGWRAEQVVPELERYLNDAYMAGLSSVRIVHGKGTGVLRQVVRDYLASTGLVSQFETADQREGGEGATVAHLAL